MKKVLLKDIAEFQSGYAFKSKEFNKKFEGLPIVRIRNVMSGYSDTYYGGEYEEKYLINRGDILVTMDGDFNVAVWNGETALQNQRVGKIIPSNLINKSYLIEYLKIRLKKINDKTSFVTVKHISNKDIMNLEIPLPPIEEQKRIADILDKAKLIIKQRNNSIIKLDAFLKSTFLYIVGPKSEKENEWKKYKISELAVNDKKSMRTGPFGSDLKHSEFVDEGISVLGIDNAVNNHFKWGQRRYISEEKYTKLKRYTVFPNDVIITIMGTTGRSAVVPKNIPTAISTKHLATITLNNDIALPEYLSFAIHSHPEILQQINIQNKGAIMNGLNLGIIKNLELKVPPIELQKDFKNIYLKVMKMRKEKEQSLSKINELYNSLLLRVFKDQFIEQMVG